MADVVLWSGDPFSVYSHAELVFIDGALVFAGIYYHRLLATGQVTE